MGLTATVCFIQPCLEKSFFTVSDKNLVYIPTVQTGEQQMIFTDARGAATQV